MRRSVRPAAILVCGVVVAVAAAGRAPEKDGAAAEGVGRVAPGEYVELDEQGVPNPSFVFAAREVTPNIIEVRGVNGWVAFAAYDEEKKEYRGCFEWQQFGPHRSPGGKWADLYQVRLVRLAGGRVEITGKSKANDMTIRAVPKS
jgi:hypothetical protein